MRARATTRPVVEALVIVAVLLASGCGSDPTQPEPPADDAPSATWTAEASANEVAAVVAERCGPAGREQLFTEVSSRDPATAARRYADETEPEWQQLAEEACYLALVNQDP